TNKSTNLNITSDQIRLNQLRATLNNIKGSENSSTLSIQENFNELTTDKGKKPTIAENDLALSTSFALTNNNSNNEHNDPYIPKNSPDYLTHQNNIKFFDA
ncbi:11638_t:CDS:2, partial [Gigaspora rosea]